ncbi:MAG: hypothetical protein WCG85_18810 [Polyangia bacterium]
MRSPESCFPSIRCEDGAIAHLTGGIPASATLIYGSFAFSEHKHVRDIDVLVLSKNNTSRRWGPSACCSGQRINLRVVPESVFLADARDLAHGGNIAARVVLGVGATDSVATAGQLYVEAVSGMVHHFGLDAGLPASGFLEQMLVLLCRLCPTFVVSTVKLLSTPVHRCAVERQIAFAQRRIGSVRIASPQRVPLAEARRRLLEDMLRWRQPMAADDIVPAHAKLAQAFATFTQNRTLLAAALGLLAVDEIAAAIADTKLALSRLDGGWEPLQLGTNEREVNVNVSGAASGQGVIP